MNQIKFILLVLACYFPLVSSAQTDYNLWLQYDKIEDSDLKQSYLKSVKGIKVLGNSKTLEASREELSKAYNSFFNQELETADSGDGLLILANIDQLPANLSNSVKPDLENINSEGYIIKSATQDGNKTILITAKTDIGVLYGTFRLIKEMQLHNDISNLAIIDSPKIQKRVLNHWDNLDRTVERGYAGFSIWDWHLLPDLIKPEYTDYARANASIGINGTVLTNVNANSLILTEQYIEKVKALAEVFRPYGIQVYLTARFSAPMESGDVDTADPLNAQVKQWWKDKADEIYAEIPDFGGFLVKANSEGQPGPNNYDRTHVDGANMLAEAVAPHDGIVMWRAFVYSEHDPEDRAKQAYSEFVPFDGQFKKNVLVQVKNGAIDFQPREPFHPIFGAMPNTPLMMEFQITQEYLGFASHLVFLPKLFEETLDEDTYVNGENSTVAKVIDGSLSNKKLTGIAGVANIGTAKNWTGHPFGQSSWYGFGRLAWDPYLDSERIAEEWLKMTFTNEEEFVDPMTDLLIKSREAVVKYMTPLGLHHIMNTNHHYGPGPWVSNLSRPEWNPVYYHKADEEGIGFDRTISGSDALAQYADPIAQQYSSPETTPEKYLLWFHHLPWDYQMDNGETLWHNLATTYQEGVEDVEEMVETWNNMEEYVDEERFKKVSMLLQIQLKEAKWWRNACLSYFQQFSDMELPESVPQPEHDLEYYKSLEFPFAPGIRPSWE
ncbi:alpha-glucuronidase family glycosyl hydrolase [Salegentibacter sp. F188]|uniref:Xylan alpha-1,2-glucuronidase n=1 Tax=Autumnicola patrickiae TaxID=3075591 RepID=A0ABU3E575_9FLAO|nr:alpha-glucuronidase family glycosyl hydrolase [Salegentibacter sp. F188]MDT0690387.1 alpha-glucuronidase family glycosyl hydrolase [Salegentibacter sp. F188]